MKKDYYKAIIGKIDESVCEGYKIRFKIEYNSYYRIIFVGGYELECSRKRVLLNYTNVPLSQNENKRIHSYLEELYKKQIEEENKLKLEKLDSILGFN